MKDLSRNKHVTLELPDEHGAQLGVFEISGPGGQSRIGVGRPDLERRSRRRHLDFRPPRVEMSGKWPRTRMVIRLHGT